MLHFGLYRPHPPFAAPAPYHDSTPLSQIPAPVRAARPEDEAGGHPYMKEVLATQDLGSYMVGGEGRPAGLTNEELRLLRQAYAGLIEEADTQIGRVLDVLAERGELESTLIVFTSDHGEQLGDHYMLGKMGFYDQSYHVPLIVVDPRPEADATRGRIIEWLTESIDVLPTILDWTGIEVPHTCDGASLLAVVRGLDDTVRDSVHFEFAVRGGFLVPDRWALGMDYRTCDLGVLRTDRYKYVHFQSLPPLLFDLQEDPGELRDRSSDSAYGAVMLAMTQKMLSWRMHYAERELVNLSASPKGLVRVD